MQLHRWGQRSLAHETTRVSPQGPLPEPPFSPRWRAAGKGWQTEGPAGIAPRRSDWHGLETGTIDLPPIRFIRREETSDVSACHPQFVGPPHGPSGSSPRSPRAVDGSPRGWGSGIGWVPGKRRLPLSVGFFPCGGNPGATPTAWLAGRAVRQARGSRTLRCDRWNLWVSLFALAKGGPGPGPVSAT